MKFISGLLTGIIVSSLFFLFYLKKQTNTTPTENIVAEAEAPAEEAYDEEAGTKTGFMEFYIRFHEDSLYQLQHISFPLEGIPPRAEDGTLPDDFKWEKEDWKLHKLFDDMDGKFVQNINEISDHLVIDQIAQAQGNFAMERRFAKIGNEWQLIYYAAMNDRTQE